MNQAEQYDLLIICMAKLERIKAATLIASHVDLSHVLDNPSTTSIIFADGSKEIKP
jgi:hypothetical protein